MRCPRCGLVNPPWVQALNRSASLLAALVYGDLLLYPFVTAMRWHEPPQTPYEGTPPYS
jgi:hypothetical protein